MATSSQELPKAYKQAVSRLLWWAASVPIYVKILGIGLFITTLFAGVAFYEIRSSVFRAHYKFHGETALSIALSLASRLKSIDIVKDTAALDREVNQTLAGFSDIRYIIVQDEDKHILSHGFTFPKEAPPDLLQSNGDLCSSCHTASSPVELPADLLEVPAKMALSEGGLRAYSRSGGLVLEVTVPVREGSAASLRLGVGDKMIVRDMASISRSILWGLVLCVLASLCSALAVTYVLNRPIRALLSATNRVREGDFAARAPVYSDDEIGRLAAAFNRMAEGLAESKQRLLRADRLASIGEFAAGIAHEINNPLDGVMSCLARLQRDPANLAQNMEYMQMIQHALKRVSTVIQRLLEYSQTREIHFEPEDVHVVIENVVALVRVMAQQGSVDIEYEFGEDVPLVAGDRYYLEQALLNLALNALAAMPQGGTITFRTRVNEGTSSEGRRVEVDVVDTGTGIEPANLPRVFDPFFTTKEPGRGTGLGLAIVKEIIESHGGTITVESVLGGGTMVRVLLPAGDAPGAGRSLLEKVSL